MNRILFDASSTNPISELIAVAPGDCVLLNSWGLALGETAQVFRALVALGSIPAQQSGSCVPPPQVTAAAIQNETEYLPCNMAVEVGQQANQNITSLVIQQPGFYRVHLTPSALGTAFVEAVVLTGEEACSAAARQCCCVPEAWWEGSSLNPCLTITPGGEAGHSPVFNLDACCLLHAFPALPNPADTDELVVLSGGQCFRSTIAQVFDPAVICTTISAYLLQLPLAGDALVVVDAGANCKRVDGETFVEFFETPWTGISVTPALAIAAGGINGHGPTFSYDLCADLQAVPACTCEPAPGDEVVIIQAGACVRATWPVVNVCDQVGLLPNGALIVGDTVLVREAGGACKQVLASTIAQPFDGGVINNPILGADGSCAAPTYSFQSDPSSGMFYNGVNSSVVIGDANCTDFIEIGNSVDLNAATSFIRLRGGYLAPGAACGLIVETNNIERLRIGSNGAWNLGGGGGGAPGQVITSNGFGTPPTWQNATLTAGFGPIFGADGSCLAPTYSFVSSPDSGMFYDPAGVGSVIIGDDNCADSIAIGASIAITTNSVLRHTYTSAGAWNIGGSEGIVGQFIGSNGPGVAPTWQTPAAGGVVEPNTQIVYGTGVGVDSDTFFRRDVTTGRVWVNYDGSQQPFAVTPSAVEIHGGRNTNAVGGAGGTINITAGSMTTATIGTGGEINVTGGRGGDGGRIIVLAGIGDGLGRPAGSLFLRGGAQVNGTSDPSNVGGDVQVLAGSGGAGARGGNILIRAGNNGAGTTVGTNNIALAFDGVPGVGTTFSMFANPATGSTWTGGDAATGSPAGQNIQIQTGGGGAIAAAPAGTLFLGTGLPNGAGANGEIHFYYRGAALNRIGRVGPGGDWALAGVGGSGAGPTETILAAATTLGFTWLPRITAAPVGVPAAGFGGWSIPFVAQNDGAGGIVLWAYDSVTGPAWRSITLT